MHSIAQPYRSPLEYLQLKPLYRFNGGDEMLLIAKHLNNLAHSCRRRALTLMDCGAGTGRIWRLLAPEIRSILAVEPNTALWVERPGVSYIAEEGLSSMARFGGGFDLICWLWSLNYALLSFFESYDPVEKAVRLQDWQVGDQQCRMRLSAALEATPQTRILIVYFDSDSIEQQFVTSLWQKVAPFPFNNRAYTRQLFESVASQVCSETGREFSKMHIAGQALFRSEHDACQSILGFHLRGHFEHDEYARLTVADFVKHYNNNGAVQIPAGVFIYTIAP